MASKRTRALDPTTIKTDKYISVDGDSQAEAERYDLNSLIGVSDIRVGTKSLSAGSQEVLFADLGTTNYLVFGYVRDSEGVVSYLTSNYLSDRFTVQVAYACTMDFLIFKTS
jgi:hypothetical protein